MALYMIFDTHEAATIAGDQISAAMGFPLPENVTAWWNHARQRMDGKWVLLWPGNEWLETITEVFTIEHYDPAWFPNESLGE